MLQLQLCIFCFSVKATAKSMGNAELTVLDFIWEHKRMLSSNNSFRTNYSRSTKPIWSQLYLIFKPYTNSLAGLRYFLFCDTETLKIDNTWLRKVNPIYRWCLKGPRCGGGALINGFCANVIIISFHKGRKK